MSTEKLDLSSPDLVNQNIEKIAALFPNCVTETAEGKAIDFDLLKQELNHEVVEGAKERYRLEWPGKKEAIVTANLPTTKTLRPVRKDSVNFDTTENMYIEGDNLEVLKILQESYLGKIKMIYIDPPYNTGKDFVYKDNFTQDSTEFKEETNQIDEYGNRLVANPETAGRYHSDWLSMMYPRLKLARNLLTDDGVIFMSIDDNEVHNLRKIGDEVFGESNFISSIIWRKKYGIQNDAKYFSVSHEYLLCFAKDKPNYKPNLVDRTDEQDDRYKNLDNDPRGNWKSADLSVGRVTEKDRYTITTPSGRKVTPPEGRSWVVNEKKFLEMVDDNRIWFGNSGNNVPSVKKFLAEVKQGLTPSTFWDYDEVGHTDGSNKALKRIFDGKSLFDYPKPVNYLKKALTIGSNENDLVLDFFSGSGSLAEATISLNAEKEESNRKFLCVQLPEATDEKSEAYKAGYKNICEIGKERIRRAATKIKEETKADIDYGFKVFKVDSSNMQDVYYKPQDYNQGQLDVFADNIKEDRTSEDLLTQILLDWGLPLTLKTQKETVLDKEVFVVDTNYLLACFDTELDEAFAKAIAKHQPLRFVCKDSSFKNDTAKENVKQLLKQLSPNTEMKVI
ncbi:site-specific DNA-methyltransferase [Algibacter pacificus]|uniref:site-specific DNA-methyltransferase n=1 Tax=Algibacter pacificus TaxID=2599389 RepID=UPI0011C928AC|nr:site-specific DNA-methyltransferase [Algibacter pacificus]